MGRASKDTFAVHAVTPSSPLQCVIVIIFPPSRHPPTPTELYRFTARKQPYRRRVGNEVCLRKNLINTGFYIRTLIVCL